jgi:hypothetical protein
MTRKPEVLKSVPLFALPDDDETAVLASQVEVKSFGPRERIYKMGASAVFRRFRPPSLPTKCQASAKLRSRLSRRPSRDFVICSLCRQ